MQSALLRPKLKFYDCLQYHTHAVCQTVHDAVYHTSVYHTVHDARLRFKMRNNSLTTISIFRTNLSTIPLYQIKIKKMADPDNKEAIKSSYHPCCGALVNFDIGFWCCGYVLSADQIKSYVFGVISLFMSRIVGRVCRLILIVVTYVAQCFYLL